MLIKFKLYDVFLVDNDGYIVYSDFKEKDFGTNLMTGPYKNSGLARVYKKALKLKKGEVVFDDFNFYEASYNTPSAFLATPILDEGDVLGVLIFQLPIKNITRIMSFNGEYKKTGLGDTGEAYLVGKDKLMRNDGRFLKDLDDELVKKTHTTIKIFKIDSPSVNNALNGKEGSWIIKNYKGKEVLSAYAPINIYGKKWAIVAEIEKNEALSVNKEITMVIVISSIVVIIGFIILSYILINILIVSKLDKLQSAAQDLAMGEGDLSKRIILPKGDEFYNVAKNINAFIEKVRETIIEAKMSSEENILAAEKLSKSSKKLNQDIYDNEK